RGAALELVEIVQQEVDAERARARQAHVGQSATPVELQIDAGGVDLTGIAVSDAEAARCAGIRISLNRPTRGGVRIERRVERRIETRGRRGIRSLGTDRVLELDAIPVNRE